jgi:hypothetical protein
LRSIVLAIVVFALCGFATRTQPFRLRGRVRADLPVLTFVAPTTPFTDEYSVKSRMVTVHEGKQLVQTIWLADNPIVTFKEQNPLSLEDVDCDGYRDLAVTIESGIHGDTWERLFRFDPKLQKFVEVKGFEQYPSPEPECKLGILHTYVNSGAAGCMYEQGTYRWVGGKLEPLEKESQDLPDAETGKISYFVRTIDRWQGGHRSRRTIKIPIDDCHADSPK